MPSPPHPDRAARDVASIALLSGVARAFLVALLGASRGALLFLLALVALATDPPVTPPVLFSLFAVLVALPAAAAELLRRAFAASARVSAASLVLRRRDAVLTVPLAAIAGVAPWLLPWPGAGVSLHLAGGDRLGHGVLVRDPLPLLAALAEGGVAAAAAGLVDWRVAYAHFHAVAAARRIPRAVLKYGLFPLFPAAVLFNAHQHIAYGGTLGEVYLLGVSAWLRTLAVYVAATAIYMLLFAAAVRAGAEALAIAATRARVRSAQGIRRTAEIGCAIAYYAGVPLLLALRFAS